MAMINCPECGQEISDKAKKCIHCGKVLIEEKPETKSCGECGKEVPVEATECSFCGCPIEKVNGLNKAKEYIIPACLICLVVITGIFILVTQIVIPSNKYNRALELFNDREYEQSYELLLTIKEYSDAHKILQEIDEIQEQEAMEVTYIRAKELLENGKYEEGRKVLETISSYKDVNIVLEQIKWESKLFTCVNILKGKLKNPDSFTFYEAQFYQAKDDNNPALVLHYGAQNGFGGNTAGYALFTYSTEYELQGTCDSLSENDYDKSDLGEAWELIICEVIKALQNEGTKLGEIDVARVKIVLKNEAYSIIKIIE